MNMFLSEMQEKDVISLVNGQCYGHIVDAQVDNKGQIISFIAVDKNIFRKIKNTEITFTYSNINKIGKDVILIDV